MGLTREMEKALRSYGLDLSVIEDLEPDAALGNGGLGRLAACFMESLASLDIPAYGYGIRYVNGMFRQRIDDGWQVELPETWLSHGNPWEFDRRESAYRIGFGGEVVDQGDGVAWIPAEQVEATAVDTPVVGWRGKRVNTLRLWTAIALDPIRLDAFNAGDYTGALAEEVRAESLVRVLYPADSSPAGQELRLRQEYFFTSASIQDIVRRHLQTNPDVQSLPDKAAIQLNDTHPAVAVAELMRLLVDVHGTEFNEAWDITRRTVGYTNHTLLPEALETWPIDLFSRILPRHLEIIFQLNHEFLQGVRYRHPGDTELLKRVSLITEGDERRIRMAHLAVIGSHKVNGVAAIHTGLMKSTIFSDFEHLSPGKIINMTNGVTPRRWLLAANPRLARLITSHIGDGWITDLDQLRRLEPLADDKTFRDTFAAVKRANKEDLALMIHQRLGISVDPTSLFDIQVKRIHEYKRQLLNLLQVVVRYARIRANPALDVQARTVIIGGKSAPGYALAKLIIKLVNDVAEVVNNDPLIGGRLKVVFLPNYNVSTAEIVMPAGDLSEQISTAGTEASGTGNMKLAMNGALTIGTWDGANVEICEEVGEENMFLFGLTAQEVARRRIDGYDAIAAVRADKDLTMALDMIGSGFFSPDQSDRFRALVDTLTVHGDHYLLTADFQSYMAAQERVDRTFADSDDWMRRAILNVARMGKFSSDRTVAEYARCIWEAL
jgi:starch phosphorylase